MTDELRRELVKRFGGTVTIGRRSYLRFIMYPGPVNDGTSRCIACGQIDEPHIHLADACQIARWWPDGPAKEPVA